MLRYLALPLIAVSGLATAAPKPAAFGELVMDGHDAARITYEAKCSNGANSTEDGRVKFIAAMRADKRSKLAKTLADLEAKFVPDKQWREVAIGDWVQTFHLRDGCSDTTASYSALVMVHSIMGNSHELWTKFLVTIDDDVSSDDRKLSLRSIQPVTMREN